MQILSQLLLKFNLKCLKRCIETQLHWIQTNPTDLHSQRNLANHGFENLHATIIIGLFAYQSFTSILQGVSR